MRTRRLSTVIAGALLAAAGASGGEPLRIYSAAKTGAPPAIDGELAEPCWRSAERTAAFVRNNGAALRVRTRAMLCRDHENLYVGFVCDEPLAGKLRGAIENGAIAGFEESIEVFVDGNADRHTYIQVMLNVTGRKFSARGTVRAPSLDQRWSGATAIHEADWTAEMRLPLELLGIESPSSDAVCGLNVNRTRSIDGHVVYSCWSNTKGGFHTPARFGTLIFAGYADWLGASVRSRADAISSEARELLAQYPRAAAQVAGALTALDRTRQEFRRGLAAKELTAAELQALYDRGQSLTAEYETALSKARLAVIRTEFR